MDDVRMQESMKRHSTYEMLPTCNFVNRKSRKERGYTPPYFTLAVSILWRASEALASSIQSGWFQWSFGMTPNSTLDGVSIDILLERIRMSVIPRRIISVLTS